MEELLSRLNRALWGWPLLTLLLGSGLYLLVRLRFAPILRLPQALRLVFRGASGGSAEGAPPAKPAVTAFGALCTALASTIGTGNIVGVATALTLGGPGALLWMELSAVTGLSLKYAEGWLAVRYRRRRPDGTHFGGPFAYIALGLGPRYRPLAGAFALLGALAGLCGVGTFVQVGSVTACLTSLLTDAGRSLTRLVLPWGGTVPLAAAGTGLGMALLAAWFLFGGIGRVSRLSARLVPLMGGLYVLCCLWILARFRTALPGVLTGIVTSALRPTAAGAGVLGAMTAGVSRGVFSNEAGLGVAPIAAAAAEGVTPEEQGLISMTAVVFDTLLICTLTGLAILVTGSEGAGVGAAMTAFARGLPLPELLSRSLVFGILTLFAFTTVVGWSCCGVACLDELTNHAKTPRICYLVLYTGTIVLAPLCSARAVWTAATLCNGLMAIPNITALLLLAPKYCPPPRRGAHRAPAPPVGAHSVRPPPVGAHSVRPPRRRPAFPTCHCETSAHTGRGNPFSYAITLR